MAGRHMNTPLLVFRLAPLGAATIWYARVKGGAAGSLARLVTHNMRPARAL